MRVAQFDQRDALPKTIHDQSDSVASALFQDLDIADWKTLAVKCRESILVAATQDGAKEPTDKKPVETKEAEKAKGSEKKDKFTIDVSDIKLAKPVGRSGFEMTLEEIKNKGLENKVNDYKAKIVEAMQRLGSAYKIDIRVVDSPIWGPHGTPLDSDVWTETIRNSEMRNESFVINVTAKFLKEQPAILFESSTLHEISHIMNDDLSGYHRQGANTEIAEERRVADTVGMKRYEEYLKAYCKYKPSVDFESTLQKVKDCKLVPPPVERDNADKLAEDFFKKNSDGKEHLLVYNSTLHDITLSSTRGSVSHDPEKLAKIIKEGKPMVFFHNHPAEDGTAAMYPSPDDYGVAGLYAFQIYRENPKIDVEFRVMQVGKDSTSNVAYGFRPEVIAEIKKNAKAYGEALARKDDVGPVELKQNLMNYHFTKDSYHNYLKYAYDLDMVRKDKNACKTHPQYFLWPSEKFFVHDRPQK